MGGKRAPLPKGHPRRPTDARTAWRGMDDVQRKEFLRWIQGAAPEDQGFTISYMVAMPRHKEGTND